MEELLNDFDESQTGVVDQEETEAEENEEGVEGEPAKHQSAEENAKFAAFRRENEFAKKEA